MSGTKDGWIKRKNNGLGVAWNKNKKQPPLSESHKKKISDSHKKSGLIPPNWTGKKRSPESIKKSADSRRGKPRLKTRGSNNHSWKGGITPINSAIRTSLEYKIWRLSVFERDKYTCIMCGEKNGKGKKIVLHADHIYPFAYYPDLRFDIDNGRTLCINCHKTTDSYMNNKKSINGLT